MSAPRLAKPIKLYRFNLSGHAHRVELFLSLLGLPFEMVEIDIKTGAQRQPGFLALNPFGKVPVIDDDGYVLADSNAILTYLALKYADESWLPRDPAGAAAVQKWLSVAAGEITYGPAAARIAVVFGRKLDLDGARNLATSLFGIMEQHLQTRRFLAGTETPTIADVSAYTYIAHAPEGGVSLASYPALSAWISRIEALPGFVGMERRPAAA
jgi:glutathione S-transferase